MKKYFITAVFIYWRPGSFGGTRELDYIVKAKNKKEVELKIEKEKGRLQKLSEGYDVKLFYFSYIKFPKNNNGIGTYEI